MAAQANTNHETIEAIVREVLERLAKAKPAGRTDNGAATADCEDCRERNFTERVVSVATIQGKLEGVQKIVVPHHAVITPAALDLLRASGVKVDRTARTSSAPTSTLPTIALGLAETRFEPAGLVERLRREGYSIEQLARTDVKRVVAELADAAGKGGQAAVLITETCELAACLANRNRGVRAAIVRDKQSVSKAREQIGLNFLIINPATAGGFQLQQAVREFVEHVAAGNQPWAELID